MINITVVPKTRENTPYFRNDIPFNGDITKEYSCEVVGSNMPSPKIIGYNTKVNNGIPQNYVVLEFEGRCNQTQVSLLFRNEVEVIEKTKVAFVTWVLGYFTWFNFLFRIFSLKTLKFIAKAIALGVAIPIVGGILFATIEGGYEAIYDEDFEDSWFIEEVWNKWTVPKIGRYFREDALDDAIDLKDFTMDKASDVAEATKDKAGDLKDAVSDKIDDIRD